MIKKINITKLLEKTSSVEKDHKYNTWRKLDIQDFTVFNCIGSLAIKNPIEKEYETQENYWSENYPIALNYYPNAGCDIYFDNKNYYLVYIDFGGHVPEKRCRLLQQNLIIFP